VSETKKHDMNELRQKLEETIDSALTEDVLERVSKKVRDAVSDVVEELDHQLKSDLAYNLAWWVEHMADHAVEAILNGDEEMMRRHLSCQEGHYTGRDKDHPVIHCKLFEPGALELRKRIVDAHPELLKNERILDLEDQVKSLVEQVNKAEVRNEELIQRLGRAGR